MECMAGMGVERHLFGLLTMFERFGSDLGIHSVPKIFTGRGWTRLGHDTLSTTSMPDPHGVVLSGFGPVVDDGFGIVYLIGNDSILFTITSRSHMEHSLKQFAANVTESLLEMSALMKQKVEALPFVRWVGPYHPAYKLEEEIGWQIRSRQDVEPRRYSIMLVERGVPG